MRCVIQRVQKASVTVESEITGRIGPGLLVLAAFHGTDSEKEMAWMARKICNLRIFADENGKMNESLRDDHGEILLVSQFTLYGDVRKGNRPSFNTSAPPDQAKELYHQFHRILSQELGQEIPTGIFAAHMDVELVNDGPVTIIMDSPDSL